MRSSNRHLALAVFLFVLFLPGTALGATPDWVRQAAARTLPAYEPDTDAAVLLNDVAISVSGPGEYTEHYRRAVKILRNEGRDEAQFAVYLRGREKLRFLHCWALDRAGREFELKDKDFQQRGFAGFLLYDDIYWMVGTCPAADPGSVVAFEYEVQRHYWLDEWEWFFQESIPVHESHVVVKLPAGWEYKARWAHANPIEASKAADGGWEWTMRDLPGIRREPLQPSAEALALRMNLAFFPPEQSNGTVGSWNALGRWYTKLTADRRLPTPALTEKARELAAGKTDFDSKVRILTSFLQTEIRYVAIEIGIGGYQPHPAGDVFRARYGDCKDKATLLSTMLHEVGIDSDYVVINTERGVADPALPSPRSFNHVILAIELPPEIKDGVYRSVLTSKVGKRYLIFDPTDPFTPLGELRGELQDTYALLVAEGGGELIHTPLLRPDSNYLARTGHFAVAPDGSLTGEIIENRNGDHAWHERVALNYATQQQRTQHLENRLNRSLRGFTLQSADIQQLERNDQNLVIDYKFTDPGYGQIRGPLMLVRPRVMGEKGMALERKPRKFPFQFEDTTRETDVFDFDLPPGYVVDDTPEPVKVDMGFASYESKIEVKDNKLRYSREFVRREVLLKPDQTDELRKLQGIIGADESAAVVLKRVP